MRDKTTLGMIVPAKQPKNLEKIVVRNKQQKVTKTKRPKNCK